MNISFENPDKVSGLLTITVEESDIKDDVEKLLKDYRKRANIHGFRPGMVPMGLIKKQFGASAKMDTINKFVGNKLYGYIKENNISMLGEPLPSEKQEAVDIEKDAPYTFVFDIAIAPEVKVELGSKDKIDYYDIQVDDSLINSQVDMYASQYGDYSKEESYEPEKGDLLKGDLRELDGEGNTKEGGITVENAIMSPQYIKVEEQKKLFDGCKLGDIITFNPRKAYPNGDAEISSLLKIDKEKAHALESDFSYQITEISRFTKAAVDQKLFDKAFGEGNVKSEEEFRAKIAESIKPSLQQNSEYKFFADAKKYLEDKVGTLAYSDILKRVLQRANKDKDADYVEKNYDESIKQLTWHLIEERLVADHNIKVSDDDILNEAKESVRMQFAQYGISNMPEESLVQYAKNYIEKKENRDTLVAIAVDKKVTEVVKNTVTLNKKEVSFEEFKNLMK